MILTILCINISIFIVKYIYESSGRLLENIQNPWTQ
jgi:hypothetical protein